MPTPKPRLNLDRANDGSAFIAVTYYDATGTPERTSVLSHAYGVAVDSVMKRKFEQMLDLMAGNITSDITDAFKRPADNTDSLTLRPATPDEEMDYFNGTTVIDGAIETEHGLMVPNIRYDHVSDAPSIEAYVAHVDNLLGDGRPDEPTPDPHIVGFGTPT